MQRRQVNNKFYSLTSLSKVEFSKTTLILKNDNNGAVICLLFHPTNLPKNICPFRATLVLTREKIFKFYTMASLPVG